MPGLLNPQAPNPTPPNVYQSVPQQQDWSDPMHQALTTAVQNQSQISANRQMGVNQSPASPAQATPPGAVKSYFANLLYNVGEYTKKQAGLLTDDEKQQMAIHNQQAQQHLNTEEAYKTMAAQQYGMQTVTDDQGNPIQIQAKDLGRYQGQQTRSREMLQQHEEMLQGALAQRGFKLVKDANGIASVMPMSQQEQSDFLKAQQAKALGAANQSNAKAAAIPQQTAINQQNANTALKRAQISGQKLDATITKQSGKVTSAVQNRAALADNVEENVQVMEDIASRRPDLFGPLSGRMTKAQIAVGTDDPDILAWNQANSNVVKANMGMHQMRSKYGMEHDLPNLDFKNGTEGLKGTFSSLRKSADQFRSEPNASTPKPASSGTPIKTAADFLAKKGIK